MEHHITESSIYREFLAERDEILRHKWIESEKLGVDIGFNKALVEWVMNHRTKWRKSAYRLHFNSSQTLSSH